MLPVVRGISISGSGISDFTHVDAVRVVVVVLVEDFSFGTDVGLHVIQEMMEMDRYNEQFLYDAWGYRYILRCP